MAPTSSSGRRSSPPGLQILRNVGARGSSSSTKPRIIYTCSPKVYKIKPEEFLDLVQKLTGRGSSDYSTTSSSSSEVNAESATGSMLPKRHAQDSVATSSPPLEYLGSSAHDVDADSVEFADHSSQLLASLSSPTFVTMNFLPMLAASSPIRAYNPSRRDVGFSFPSAAY